jgi:putative transposase
MTYQPDYTLSQTLSQELLERLNEEGLNALPEMIRIVINTAMQAERLKYLGVGAPYERSPERQDHSK